MATCKNVCDTTLAKLGIAGGTKPARQVDLDLVLNTLRSSLRGLIAGGGLGRPNEVIVRADYEARENDHITRPADATGSVTLPAIVDTFMPVYRGGAFDYGNSVTPCGPRAPRNGAFVVINDQKSGVTIEAIYDGYTGKWITLGDMSLDDRTEVKDAQGTVLEVRTSDCPLSADVNQIAAWLAVKSADFFNSELSPTTVREAKRFEAALVQGLGKGSDWTLGNFF